MLIRFLKLEFSLENPVHKICSSLLVILYCLTVIWWIDDSGGPVPGWCAHMAAFETAVKADIIWPVIYLIWIRGNSFENLWQVPFRLGSRNRWCFYCFIRLSLDVLSFMLLIFLSIFIFSNCGLRNFDYGLGWEYISRIPAPDGFTPFGIVMLLYCTQFLHLLLLSMILWRGNLMTQRFPVGIILVLCICILDRFLLNTDSLPVRSALLMSQNAALNELPVILDSDGALRLPVSKLLIYWFALLACTTLLIKASISDMELLDRRD